MLEENYRIELLFSMAIGTKYSHEVLIKKKVNLQVLDLEQNYHFEKIKVKEKGLELPIEVVDELEKQPQGIYYLVIEQGNFEIIKSGEKKVTKVQMANKELEMKAVRVSLQKMTVGLTGEINLIVRDKDIILTNNKEYQFFERVEFEEEPVEEDA